MNKFITHIKGIIVPNLIAFTLLLLMNKYLLSNKYLLGENWGSLFIFSTFFIAPILMGIASYWIWRNLNLRNWLLVLYGLISSFFSIALSIIFLKEGSGCAFIILPVVVPTSIVGVFVGKKMFRQNNQKLNVSVVFLLFVIFVADTLSQHNYKNMVSDQIVINAPVTEVWKYVVAYKKNNTESKYFLFKIGVPSPVESTVEGYHLGAKRKCIFSNGYTFDEKIVAYDINKNLTFDITNQPRDPEIMGHIDILRGQFLLKDNRNGTTTLTGNSWYRLYVFPVWCFDIWTQSVTRNVHLRVMQHIKQLSEGK